MGPNADSDSHDPVRDGFRISVWRDGDYAVISARPSRLVDEQAPERPALPSRARLLVWAGRQGVIRERLRGCSRWARLVAWLRRGHCARPAEQLELLTDELLATISVFELSEQDSWAEPGNRSEARPPLVRTNLGTYPGALAARRGRGRQILLASSLLAIVVLTAFVLISAGAGADANTLAPEDMPPISIDLPASTSVAPDQQSANTEEPVSETAPVETAAAGPSATPRYVFVAAEEPALRELATVTAGEAQEYVVEPGDSLLWIARRFETDLEQLVAANGLVAGAAIFPGQVLRLP